MMGGQIHIPPESSDCLPQAATAYIKHLRQPWPQRVKPVFDAYMHNEDFKFWELQLGNYLSEVSNWPTHKQNLAALIEFIYMAHAKINNPGATFWGDKTPFLMLNLDWLKLIFPQAIVIHLIRDPRAVVCSRIEAFSEDTDTAINRWLWAVDSARKWQGQMHIQDIYYEQLVADPQKQLRKICDLTGLDYSGKMIESSAHLNLGDTHLPHHKRTEDSIDSKSVNRWQSALTSDQLERIRNRTERLCKELGYEW